METVYDIPTFSCGSIWNDARLKGGHHQVMKLNQIKKSRLRRRNCAKHSKGA